MSFFDSAFGHPFFGGNPWESSFFSHPFSHHPRARRSHQGSDWGIVPWHATLVSLSDLLEDQAERQSPAKVEDNSTSDNVEEGKEGDKTITEAPRFAVDRLVRRQLAPRLPRLEVKDHDDTVELEFELPGISKEDCKVELDGDRLTISGESKFESSEKKEDGEEIKISSSRNFRRSLRLPLENFKTDELKANFKDGVLSLSLPKLVPEPEEPPKVKQISIE